MRFTTRVRQFSYVLATAAFLFGWMSPCSATANSLPDRVKLLQLIHQGAFGELESLLKGYLADYRAGKISDHVIEQAFEAFASADPKLESKLDRWIKDWPNSASPRLARARYNTNFAWIYRGYALAKNVSKSQFATMHLYIAKAAKDLTAALKLDPNLGVAYGAVIQIAMMEGKTAVTDVLIKQALRADPRSFVARRRYLYSLVPWWRGGSGPSSTLNSVARISKFVTKVKQDARTNSALPPLFGFDRYVVGELFTRNNQRKEAIPFFEEALKSGEYMWYRHRAGHNYYRLKQYDLAVENFTKALALWPMVPDTLDWRARSLRKSGQLEKALADWNLALTVDPRNPRILLQLAYGLREAKRYEDVLSTLDLAILYGANDENLRDARGRILLYELNRPAEAVADLRRATELKPTRSRYWYNYGLSLYKLKNCEAAGALATYQSICIRKSDCSATMTQWAASVIRYLKDPRVCPAQPTK